MFSQFIIRTKLGPLLLSLALAATGCVRIPLPQPTEGIKSSELSAHVSFLAQPALKGRKPATHGSLLARHYIVERFKAYGLVPWGREKQFVESFGYGNNIIGVLQGSDTNLSSEFVLVSAHYDHLGKDHGRLCLGAADNASGVAALLETAKQMSLYQPRPKRSVVFAAFDSEEMMLLGSFAFSCRPDVEQARLVAVVNMDILGRNFMDVMSNTLFVTGTEQYPALREHILRSSTNAGVNLRPIGTDLIGPRGDHAAFEERPIPCMFFSSGMYGDYHKPTDTADKLNYAAMERSTKVVFETVRELASCRDIGRSPVANLCDLEELRTINMVMTELSSNSAQVGIKAKDADLFKKLLSETERLAKEGRYNSETREKLIADASPTLAPYFMSLGGSQSSEQEELLSATIPFLHQHYVKHKEEWLQGCRQMVRHILKYRPGVIRNMPKFTCEIATIADDDISFLARGQGKYTLNVLFTPASLTVEKRLLGFHGNLDISVDGMDGEGTRLQLTDLCLLRLRRDRSNAPRSKEISKVLCVVTGADIREDYSTLLERRLAQGGFKNETEWLVDCMLSNNPDLAMAATSCAQYSHIKDTRVRDAACKLVADRSLRSDVRATAIGLVASCNDRKALLQLCNVLDDTTPAYRKEYAAVFGKEYPFSGAKESLIPLYEQIWKQGRDSKKTLGELAETRLKSVTKKDFKNDRQAWQKWIEKRSAK